MKLVVGIVLCCVLFACGDTKRNASVKAANEGAKAYGQKQWETAIERYTKATERWDDNHSAWYGLAASYAARKEWAKAADAAGQAVTLEPDIAMYHLMYGRMLYEKVIDEAKEDQARREGKKKEEIVPDLTSANFEKALQHLQQATKLNPELWRAYYLIGSIYRFEGKAKEAAEQFSKSLEFGAFEEAPWIALCELYRNWDYTDQAIQVALQGTKVIPGENEKSEIYFELGMGYDDKRNNDEAIKAFDKALQSKRDNHKAKFARGQAYYRRGAAATSDSQRAEDFAKAKRDLEEFSKSGGVSVEFFKQQASRMLMDMAARSAGGGGGTPGTLKSPADLVKDAQKKHG